jgi:hypothetical protein
MTSSATGLTAEVVFRLDCSQELATLGAEPRTVTLPSHNRPGRLNSKPAGGSSASYFACERHAESCSAVSTTCNIYIVLVVLLATAVSVKTCRRTQLKNATILHGYKNPYAYLRPGVHQNTSLKPQRLLEIRCSIETRLGAFTFHMARGQPLLTRSRRYVFCITRNKPLRHHSFAQHSGGSGRRSRCQTRLF